VDQIIALLLFGTLIIFVLTFIESTRLMIARTVLAPNHIKLSYARWTLGICAMLSFILLGILAPPEQPVKPTPSVSEATPAPSEEDVIRSAISSGNGFFNTQELIQADAIKEFSFDREGIMKITIDLGEWWDISGGELRAKLVSPLGTFYRIANAFPEIKKMFVDFESAAAEQRNEVGQVVNQGAMAELAQLNIDCEDLRRFPKNVDWDSYALYAANRYVAFINFHQKEAWQKEAWQKEAWQKEVDEETRLGGFTPTEK
jgi:hypothetical protein